MVLEGCKLCERLYPPQSASIEICPECTVLQNEQYQVAFNRIAKLMHKSTPREIAKQMGIAPQHVHGYLEYRLGNAHSFSLLEGHRPGLCYLCHMKVYSPFETACLDCLQRIQAILEERSLKQVSRMGKQRTVQVRVRL